MSDQTPPPDEPMPEQSRARIRADLLAAAQDGGGGRASRWLVPGVAAAAVVLVAALATWAVQVGGDDDPSGGPAASTPSTPSTPSESSAPTKGSKELTRIAAEARVQARKLAGSASCEQELVNVLPGAERAVAFPEDGGTTSFWVKGDRFVLCDERAGTVTVQHPHPLLDEPADDVETYRVSSVYAPAKSGFTISRVAGGLVPKGSMAFDVSYAFPDGHTETSTTTTDEQGRTWWRMAYSYHEDSGVNEMNLPPIEATLSLSGVQTTYTLDWAVDTCAQANHGC